jgi:phosphatidylinositol alpha-1,6-mannosyltransferase
LSLSEKKFIKFVLLTNDFPPKVGGIQSYLWELFKRLDLHSYLVVTTNYDGATNFDKQSGRPLTLRLNTKLIIPTPVTLRVIQDLLLRYNCNYLIVDPVFPTGLIGYRLKKALGVKYGVIIHGAESTISAKLPFINKKVKEVLEQSSFVIAAGHFVLDKTLDNLSTVVDRKTLNAIREKSYIIEPGVDINRFYPVSASEKIRLRSEFKINPKDFLILGVSRLVPRKGFDVLIKAVSKLQSRHPDITLVIAGSGKDYWRLKILSKIYNTKVLFLKGLNDMQLTKLYQCADLFVVLCRDRFFGLEQEGFGIVFLEAQASGIPQVAGLSGGSNEAVKDGVTGVIVKNPKSVYEVKDTLESLYHNKAQLQRMSKASVKRAKESFSYEVLADKLRAIAESLITKGGGTDARKDP